jgi:hypothetical protein
VCSGKSPRGNRSLGDEGPRAALLYWRTREEIGEILDESEATLIVVGEATLERAIEEQTKRAKKGDEEGGQSTSEGDREGDRRSVIPKRTQTERR